MSEIPAHVEVGCRCPLAPLGNRWAAPLVPARTGWLDQHRGRGVYVRNLGEDGGQFHRDRSRQKHGASILLQSGGGGVAHANLVYNTFTKQEKVTIKGLASIISSLRFNSV
jgi:hypothetical protein